MEDENDKKLKKGSRMVSCTMNIEESGGKNATERNNEGSRKEQMNNKGLRKEHMNNKGLRNDAREMHREDGRAVSK